MTTPFDYPAAPHVRKHGPRGYRDYASYLAWLRDEFDFRCVYCLTREQWGRVRGLYAIDHFLPVAQHPERAADYDNLLYACVTCNATKGSRELPDPSTALSGVGVRVGEDGVLRADSPEAAELIELLNLNHPMTVVFRLHWIEVVALVSQHGPALHRRLMGYPDDLPDLARLQPPEGNARPEGVRRSAHARRARGELPETY